MKLLAPISVGELYDKLSILEIKLERITDDVQLANVRSEVHLLKELINEENVSEKLFYELRKINSILWDTENIIRLFESKKNFGEEFIQAARKIYTLNCKRHEIKKAINEKYNSLIVEEKSYVKF